jgi:oligopeptide/dipeptide ABC transporter ATP-binding protein
MLNKTGLRIQALQVTFPQAQEGSLAPVRDLSLEVPHGRTTGLVGESGSGKSLTALAILGLVSPPGRTQGSIQYDGRELLGLDAKALEQVRGAQIAMVFQDPAAALNPVLTIGEQLLETIRLHKGLDAQNARRQVIAVMRQVDLPEPETLLRQYPHQLSGGMKQRVLIAMALVCDPSLLILDEPTTALDVTVQAQILDLVELIQRERHLSILLISHDLSVVAEVSDEISIIYAGRVVETAPTAELLNSPKHPYTRGLLNSIPTLSDFKQPLETIPGFPPDPAELPSGCPFHPRCPRKMATCPNTDPDLTRSDGRDCACWNPVPRP